MQGWTGLHRRPSRGCRSRRADRCRDPGAHRASRGGMRRGSREIQTDSRTPSHVSWSPLEVVPAPTIAQLDAIGELQPVTTELRHFVADECVFDRGCRLGQRRGCWGPGMPPIGPQFLECSRSAVATARAERRSRGRQLRVTWATCARAERVAAPSPPCANASDARLRYRVGLPAAASTKVQEAWAWSHQRCCPGRIWPAAMPSRAANGPHGVGVIHTWIIGQVGSLTSG